MARVVFTAHLRRYTGGVTETRAEGERIRELLQTLDEAIPGIRHYLVTDVGSLRRHVNIFVDGEPVADRSGLTDRVKPDSTIHILQALSGG